MKHASGSPGGWQPWWRSIGGWARLVGWLAVVVLGAVFFALMAGVDFWRHLL